eukprot:758914-Hanusia_phi.AAC.2
MAALDLLVCPDTSSSPYKVIKVCFDQLALNTSRIASDLKRPTMGSFSEVDSLRSSSSSRLSPALPALPAWGPLLLLVSSSCCEAVFRSINEISHPPLILNLL